MMFSGEVLIYSSDTYARTCWLDRLDSNLSFEVGKSDDIATIAEEEVRKYIKSHAMRYVNWFSHGEDWVNCPEGRAKVPADIWYCKITDDVCPIQAQVRTGDKESFLQGCNLDDYEEKTQSKRGKSTEDHKEGLWHAVSSGKYQGHHHDPGTIPCFMCDESELREEYHFPWEVTRLSNHIEDYESARTSKELLFTEDNIGYNLSNPICATCFTSLNNKYPNIKFSSYGLNLSDYISVEYSYKPNN